MYLNLFVASMLVLVLADNLLLLYLGWEGVGLCSYLLIAFWQKDPQNVYSGRKALHRHPRRRHCADRRVVPAVHAAAHPADPAAARPPRSTASCPARQWPSPPPCSSSAAPWASRRRCRCRRGCRTRWPARRRSARSSTPPPWSPPASTSSRAPTCSSRSLRDARLVVAIVGTVTLLLAGFSAARPARPQARARLLDDQPDRLHVPGARRVRLGGGRVPLHDARLLQGPALPRPPA